MALGRTLATAAVLAATALGATGCLATGGGKKSTKATFVDTSPSAKHKPVTLLFWSDYTARELKVYDQSLAIFHKKYPWITVKGVGNQDDSKIKASIAAGKPPDAVLSFSPDNLGQFCVKGLYLALKPYIDHDGLDVSIFPVAARSYSNYRGNYCSLPALTDAYGLYYNTELFKKAGIAQPPKTLSELFTDAKKLTVRNADGSIKQIGFNPLFGHYEDLGGGLQQAYGARWFDPALKSLIAKDPRWAQLFTWQKKLVDWYGYNNLQKFTAGSAEEFSASNDFEIGRSAMQFDGEWRVSFIQADKPKLTYATAPFPAADTATGRYGSGQIGGDIVAIPRGSPHPAEAWLLVKFLATDTDNLVRLSNGLANLPTTEASVASPKILPNPRFKIFFSIFRNKLSTFPPITPIGFDYATFLDAFESKWQAGKISNLPSALKKVASEIDSSMSQAAAGG